jgi:HAD superfamily hydrolase (TIGR01549 family)
MSAARTRYRTVLLDAGGVLVYPNWARAAEALGRHGVVVSPDALAAAEPYVKRQLDVAPTVAATNDAQRGYLYFDCILRQAGIGLSAATAAALADLKAFNDTEGTWDQPAADAFDTLRRLRADGHRIAVVSNSNGTIRRMFRRVGLEPLVDVIVDSHEEGVEKPNPGLFEIALARAGSSKAEAIHCGDMYQVDVVGARAAGLPAVLLDEAGLCPHDDCPRVASLAAFADGLLAGRFD